MADADRSKGVSLRKRENRRQGQESRSRPPNGLRDGPRRGPSPAQAPSQGRPSMESVNSTEVRPRPRPKANDSTTNMVKKRYSVRYNQVPDITQGAPPLPGLPQLPPQFAQQNGSSASLGQQQGQGVDLRALRDPNLQPDQYLAGFLATASESDLAEYQRGLRHVKNRASTDLQRNVNQNRTQFIKISKEAERLKGEMQTLQGLMSDLSVTLEQAAAASGVTRESSVRKRQNRSSVANLAVLWSNELQTLWKMVEGAQKFVPAIPGRHILKEQGGWVELDSATWKPKRAVHLVLLNDNLLVAVKKRKRPDPNLPNQPVQDKNVAQYCWPLQDVEVVDLTTDAKEAKGLLRQYQQISNAITVRYGQESFTYRTEHPESKNKNEFLFYYKQAIEELRRNERADTETVNKAQEGLSYLVTRDSAVAKDPGLVESLSKSKDRPEMLIDVEGKQRNMRWVESQIDELDIEVALQRFDEAVNHVEFLRGIARGLKHNAVAQDLINVKVNERASKLADILTTQLIQRAANLGPTQTYTTYLTRLDFSARARTAYLSSRTATIHARVRQCVFEGHTLNHITALSYVYFTLIKNSVGVYSQCFPPQMMSACVAWAKGQLDAFNEVLARALSGVEKGGEVWKAGLARARELAGIMNEVGLDFAGLVGVGLEEGA